MGGIAVVTEPEMGLFSRSITYVKRLFSNSVQVKVKGPADVDVLVYLCDNFARSTGNHFNNGARAKVRGEGLAKVRSEKGLEYEPRPGTQLRLRVVEGGLEIITKGGFANIKARADFEKTSTDYIKNAEKIAEEAMRYRII